MEAPNQNKLVGRELAVAKAEYGDFDVNGKVKSGILFKQELTVDPVVLEMYGVTMEAMLDCVDQLEKMGSYEELSKKEGNDGGGYKPTGLVIPSKKDPKVKMSVEFGHRWNKDSDMQQAIIIQKPVTLKWFYDVDNLDKEMGNGAVPEREVSPEELDLISKIREETKEKKMEALMKPIQPMMESVKSHKDYLIEGVPLHPKSEDSAEKDPGDGPTDYEADVVAPSWQKWTARGGKPKYLGAIKLQDEFGDEDGQIQVYQAMHDDHGNLPGIHLMDPDQQDLDRAIEDAAKDGFGEIIIHGTVPPGLKLEGKEIKGAIMRQKGRSFAEDVEDVDFFGLPKLTEDKQPAKKPVAEAESTYAPTFKPAKSPLVAKDPQTKDKEVDKLDGSGKMKDKDGKPLVVGQDAIEKPHSEVGTEYDEKAGDPNKHNVGDPGDDSGDHMEGKGKSDSQQKELPSSAVKVGKPGDDSGKHMTDSKKTAKPPVQEGSAMLRRKMPENAKLTGQKKDLMGMADKDKKKKMIKTNTYEARKKMGKK